MRSRYERQKDTRDKILKVVASIAMGATLCIGVPIGVSKVKAAVEYTTNKIHQTTTYISTSISEKVETATSAAEGTLDVVVLSTCKGAEYLVDQASESKKYVEEQVKNAIPKKPVVSEYAKERVALKEKRDALEKRIVNFYFYGEEDIIQYHPAIENQPENPIGHLPSLQVNHFLHYKTKFRSELKEGQHVIIMDYGERAVAANFDPVGLKKGSTNFFEIFSHHMLNYPIKEVYVLSTDMSELVNHFDDLQDERVKSHLRSLNPRGEITYDPTNNTVECYSKIRQNRELSHTNLNKG